MDSTCPISQPILNLHTQRLVPLWNDLHSRDCHYLHFTGKDPGLKELVSGELPQTTCFSFQ